MIHARPSRISGDSLGTIFTLGAAGDLSDGQLLECFLDRENPNASEAAFAELVDRHGSLVLAVCRRELGDVHDAHDAFQATFLVLVRKARSLRHCETVGGWLVGVARRVTARARVEGARRRRHMARAGAEQLRADGPTTSAAPDANLPEDSPLFAEVERLPERFRAPVVLHYLEGLSTEATALRLGCARGTVLSRLSRARDRLRRRLEARGYVPAVLVAARWLPPELVPTTLLHDTIRAAASLGLAGAAIEGVVPATVASLTRKVARTLTVARAGTAALLVLFGAAGVTIGLAATLERDDEPGRGQAMPRQGVPTEKRPVAPSEPTAANKPLVLRGQVLDPDGRPAAGVDLFLANVDEAMLDSDALTRLGRTGADGRFEVEALPDRMNVRDRQTSTPFAKLVLAAVSPRSGPDWSPIDPGKTGSPITLRLHRDDVPIEGRILSLEGRPLAGQTVRLGYVVNISPGTLVKLRENGGNRNPALWGELKNAFAPGPGSPIPGVHTDADGRFRLTGAGRDRLVLLIIEGPSIERSFAMVLTSSDPGYRPLPLPAGGGGTTKLEGPHFVMTVAPGRVIEGFVHDRATGRPIAGAAISSWPAGRLTSDAQGRFRIAGQPKASAGSIEVTASGEPYIKVVKTMRNEGGLEPIKIDIPLERGVWVEGRVIDASTRKPVKAVVVYYPFRDNPHLKDCPDAPFQNNNVSDEVQCPTDADGRFRTVALPGGGILAIRSHEPGYLATRTLDGKVAGNVQYGAGLDFQYQMPFYHAFVIIDAPSDGRFELPDITLVPGRLQHIRVVSPDGKALPGARVYSHQDNRYDGQLLETDTLTFRHANPGKAETLLIVHEGRSLAASVSLKGDEPDPVTVVLQPAGTVTGRLVDEDGKPRPGAALALMYSVLTRGDYIGAERRGPLTTGPDGRFRIANLVPGVSYTAEVIKDNETNYSFRAEGYLEKTRWKVESGQTLDWGDVQARPYQP